MEEALPDEGEAMVSNNTRKKKEIPGPPVTQKKTATKDLIGFLIGTFASLSMATAAGCVQAMQGSVPHFELNGFRFVVTLLSTSIYFLFKRQLPMVSRREIVPLTGCCTLAVTYSFVMYACVTYLPLGVAGSTMRIFGMFLTLLLARIVLGETITVLKVSGVIIGSVGLLLVCKPEWFYTRQIYSTTDISSSQAWNSTNKLDTMNSYTSTHVGDQSYTSLTAQMEDISPTLQSEIVESKSEIVGYILALITSASSAIHIILQKAKLSQMNSNTIVFWFSLAGIISSVTISAIFETMTLPPNTYHWLLLLGHSFGACFMSMASIYCFTYSDSAVVVALALSTQIFFLFIGQYLFLRDIFPVEGTWIEILGAVLSIISVSMVPTIQFILMKCHKTNVKGRDLFDHMQWVKNKV